MIQQQLVPLRSPLLDAPEFAALSASVRSGVISVGDMHAAITIGQLVPTQDASVLLALALAVRVTRMGHVCLHLDELTATLEEFGATEDPFVDLSSGDDLRVAQFPPLEQWWAALLASPATATAEEMRQKAIQPPPPLVLDNRKVYLSRYWGFEESVAEDLLGRASKPRSGIGVGVELRQLLDQLFPPGHSNTDPNQVRAVEEATKRQLLVIGGGPGTGKTSTIARLLALATSSWDAEPDARLPTVLLAAPTGKAAARMTEALHSAVQNLAGLEDSIAAFLLGLEAKTIHRMIGSSGGTRVARTADSPVRADIVVVDEASMISLPLMARLLAAIPPETQLILLGDPNQLTSIEAGAVLGDIVSGSQSAAATSPLKGAVVMLDRVFRVDSGSQAISRLASAINEGDVDQVFSLLRTDGEVLQWIEPHESDRLAELTALCGHSAQRVIAAAAVGDTSVAFKELAAVKVLAATRRGPFSVQHWTEAIEGDLRDHLGASSVEHRWYLGRPVLITANDRINQLSNGDVGLVVIEPTAVDGSLGRRVVEVSTGSGLPRLFFPTQLAEVETWWSMTIHKSQGSEFGHTIVSLPQDPSPMLTRELLYTGVTRARQAVTIIATPEVLAEAVERRVSRASGLATRLSGDLAMRTNR